MSTSPMAARECWIYGECLKIRMMVPGAAAPGKQPGKQPIRLAVVACQICEITQNSPKIRTYMSSRSSILVSIKSEYATSLTVT